MKFGILHQFLRLTYIRTVLDSPDSFLGKKWPILEPRTAFLADFGIIEGIFTIFYIRNVWNLAYKINL